MTHWLDEHDHPDQALLAWFNTHKWQVDIHLNSVCARRNGMAICEPMDELATTLARLRRRCEQKQRALKWEAS